MISRRVGVPASVEALSSRSQRGANQYLLHSGHNAMYCLRSLLPYWGKAKSVQRVENPHTHALLRLHDGLVESPKFKFAQGRVKSSRLIFVVGLV
jgi:hypothetical protein